MFNELVESCGTKATTNKSWTVLVSGTGQFALLTALISAPLLHPQALPKASLTSFILAPRAPARIVRGEPARHLPQQHPVPPRQIVAPSFVPPTIANIVDEPPSTPEVPDSSPASVFENIVGDGPIPIVKAPAPVVPENKVTPRIRQGGSVQQAMLVSQARPVYPILAIQAHIRGDVVLHAIIDKEGKVSELQALSGHPILIPAALDAVRQWRYRPTLLNGDPVEVDTTITVSFRIGG